MGSANDTLKDQLYWLQRKGFTEKQLHFPAKEGWLRDNITRKYLDAVEAIRVHAVPREFSQQVTGFFNAQDLVHFDFRYEVDPSTLALRLAALTARLGENRVMILASGPFELLAANEIYARLAGERRAQDEPLFTNKENVKIRV